jgi:hypothetical protein
MSAPAHGPPPQDAVSGDHVWVLWWRYHDGSNAGVLRVYRDESRAQEDFELLSEATDRKYELLSVPLYGSIT